MSVNQALSAAISGVSATQQALSVIAGNVANANTAGYIDESVSQVATATPGEVGAGVDVTGINRNLDTLLQSQLWTETSGSSYANTTSQLYQQLQNIYGTPGSSSSFDAIYNNFTSTLQSLATSPGSYSGQSAVVGAAQALAQNLNSMTASIQSLRTQAEQGISSGVQSANSALQQIAQLNQQLELAPADGAAATLEDQRDQDITQLSQLMNVRVVQNSNNQISLFTSTGQQLVSGQQAAQLGFNGSGEISATSQWSATPSQDGVGTITLTSPGGNTTDLVADNAIQSGQIGAYLKMRDTILPQAQSQLDEMANQMSQALSNQTTAGTAVTSGSQAGFSVDVGGLSAGNSVQLNYTDSLNTQHTVTIVALGAGQLAGGVGHHEQSGDRRQPRRRNERSRIAAQYRSRHQSAVLQPFRNRVAGPQHRQQRRQFDVGNVDRHVADERQRAIAVVSRRLAADYRRNHGERLADHRSRRAHHRQFGGGRLAVEFGRLCIEYLVRRSDAAGLHAQSVDQRHADLFADDRIGQRGLAL